MRKALIIDRKPGAAVWMAGLLEMRLGFSPVVACNEEQALEALDNFYYDLIISETLSRRPQGTTEAGGDRWRWSDRLNRELERLSLDVPVMLTSIYPTKWYADYPAHRLHGLISQPFVVRDTLLELRKVLNQSNTIALYAA
jgi:hypothetical protein